jgi:RimJ/RimL family protein N-acetyltransferase
MVTIETDRLAIRNFGADDWQGLQEMIVKYQESEYARYDHEWPTATEEIKSAVEWFAGGDSYLAVCLKTTGKLIGFIAIGRREEREGRVHNLGYIFHPDYHGQGYAMEGCQAAMDYVFGQLAADGILTGTHPANEPSVTLLEKLGLKEIEQGEFAISREEWLAAVSKTALQSPATLEY